MLAYSMTCVTYITILSFILAEHVQGQHYNDTFKLRSDVLTGYDKAIRPLLNQTDLMHVYISYDIGPIQEINEVEETMTIYMQFTYTWTDEKMRWNTSGYHNTTSMLLPIGSVWKPDFVIIASADSDVSLDYGVATVRYYPTGSVFYGTQ